MEKSWLIQRLEKPLSGGLLGGRVKDNPFNFGGGYKNGGLSDEAMGLIRDIWSFDYMGAAEYEFGAVPESLRKVAVAAGQKELVPFTITVALKDVPRHWLDKGTEVPEGEATIYVLCQKEHKKEVGKRVLGWALGKGPDIRDDTQITSALRPRDEWDTRKVGWLELDNGFLFFTDKEMWEKTCELFEVKI